MPFAGSAARPIDTEEHAAVRPPGTGSSPGESRLAARFGQDILGAGYTVTPNLLLRYAAQLGISSGELLLVQYVLQHWWDGHKPHPSVPALAEQMGKSPRMVRYYLQGLRAKGLLYLEERRGRDGERVSNGFDLSPLFRAVREVAGVEHACNPLQGVPATDCPESLQAVAADQERDRPEIHTRLDLDRATGEGQRVQTAPTRRVQRDPNQGPVMSSADPGRTEPVPSGPTPEPSEVDLQVVLARLGAEFGDEAHPRVSLRRAQNIWHDSRLSLETFLDLLAAARTITLARAPAIVRRRVRSGEPYRKNLMPYFFATLEGLVVPESTEERSHAAPPLPMDPVVAAAERVPVTRESVQNPEPGTADALWQAVLAELRATVAPEAFRRWLESTRVLRADGQTLHIAVRDAIQRHWLQVRLRDRIEAALAAVGGRDVRLDYGMEGEG
jgi:hypothetical protein